MIRLSCIVLRSCQVRLCYVLPTMLCCVALRHVVLCCVASWFGYVKVFYFLVWSRYFAFGYVTVFLLSVALWYFAFGCVMVFCFRLCYGTFALLRYGILLSG